MIGRQAGKGRVVAGHTITTYMGGEWLVSRPADLSPEKKIPWCPFIVLGDWVGPKYGFNALEKRKIFGLVGIRTTIFRLTSTLLVAIHPVS
jgi:hypothetical protein